MGNRKMISRPLSARVLILAALLTFIAVGCSAGTAPDTISVAPVPESASPAPAATTATAPVETAAQPESPSMTEPGEDTLNPVKTSPEVEDILVSMSLREKICQMFVVYPTDVTSFAHYPVGGLIYSSGHLSGGGEAVIADIKSRQQQSPIPLLICADEEGGSVNRLMSALKTTYFGNMFGYKDDGEQTAFDNAATIATDMKRYGFNTDFAPVADVWSNPSNTVIGRRAYSDDFAQAATLVAKAVEGFKSQDLICCVKHFPGHGDTAQDSHYTSAIVTKNLNELRGQEFLPFQAAIEAGADMVMIGHLTVVSISEEPATVSCEIVTGILREELGFDGVVISDALEMLAVASNYSGGGLCVAAVSAGIDILLCPGSLKEGVDAVEAAVNNGEIQQERIDRSVVRILEMKLANGLL